MRTLGGAGRCESIPGAGLRAYRTLNSATLRLSLFLPSSSMCSKGTAHVDDHLPQSRNAHAELGHGAAEIFSYGSERRILQARSIGHIFNESHPSYRVTSPLSWRLQDQLQPQIGWYIDGFAWLGGYDAGTSCSPAEGSP